MRNTLTIGLLVCMPTVALLAVAGVAVLAGNLRHRLGHATSRQRHDAGMPYAPVAGLPFPAGHDHDQPHDESLPCR